MKTKKNTSIYIVIAVVFVVLYLLFAVKPLAKEYHYNPVWKIYTSNQIISDDASQKFYFKIGGKIGYFTENKNITLSKTYSDYAAISDYYYATYDTNARNLDFFDNRGNLCGTLESEGFPFFDENRIFVFLPGGSSFAFCNPDGKTKWTGENVIPITAFSSNENFTAAGYADGNIRIFENSDGNNILTYAPGGSDYPVIMGVGISDDGNLIASVSGHESQRFVLAQKQETQTKILYHKFLETDSNYRTLVHFCEDQKKVFYSYKDNLGIYDYEKNQNYSIPVKGQILSIKENDELVILLGYERDKAIYTVYFVEKSNSLEGSFSFKASSAFIHVSGNNLFVGKDDTISKINISKE